MGLARVAKHYRKHRKQVKPAKVNWLDKVVAFVGKLF